MDGSHCVATIRLPFALTIDATFMIESPSHVFSRCESGRRSRNASIIGAATHKANPYEPSRAYLVATHWHYPGWWRPSGKGRRGNWLRLIRRLDRKSVV